MISRFFSIGHRNPGHWDIAFQNERAFRIRGEPGRVTVHDERTDEKRPFPRERLKFPSVSSAMAYISDEIMAIIEADFARRLEPAEPAGDPTP